LGFATFGRVIEGMDVVKDIHKQPDNETSFTPPIAIKDIVRL
jgi:cyclophilin family peptidyl-prolyl cis-trans isomerase